ncbi:MAG: hypothetical protein K2L37_02160, partial [Lactobacillus sp.]|nr:hypothetical protein [Lactobacillus sp.]
MAHRFYESLCQENISILACLDQNAMDKKPIGEIPVLLPDNQVITEYQKRHTLVIITQIDVYTHPSIAEFLSLQGYQFILYLGALDAVVRDTYFTQLNEAFNRLRYEGKLLGSRIPRYKKTPYISRQVVIRNEGTGDVTAYVPLPLLFTASRDTCFKESAIPAAVKPFWDRSVLEYLFALPIFNFFENGLAGNWRKDLACYRDFSQYDANIFGKFDTEQHFAHTLSSRYHIYQKMCQMFSWNSEYFSDFPLYVRWNDRGYFNIEDGNNRAAFLMCKNQFVIPCRMSKQDYEKWLRAEQMLAFENACKDFPDFSPTSCFPYPVFFPFQKYEKDIYLQTVCALLGERDYSIQHKKVLCLEQVPSYLPHHFHKMGANVISVVGEFYDIASKMREIFDAPGMELLPAEEFKRDMAADADI